MNIRFLTIAETEVDEAVSWYQEKSQDESLRFLNELDRSIQVVTAYPLIHAFQKKSTRRTKTPKHEIDLIKDRLKRLREMLR